MYVGACLDRFGVADAHSRGWVCWASASRILVLSCTAVGSAPPPSLTRAAEGLAGLAVVSSGARALCISDGGSSGTAEWSLPRDR